MAKRDSERDSQVELIESLEEGDDVSLAVERVVPDEDADHGMFSGTGEIFIESRASVIEVLDGDEPVLEFPDDMLLFGDRVVETVRLEWEEVWPHEYGEFLGDAESNVSPKPPSMTIGRVDSIGRVRGD